jgi:dipeptidyl aminopeptidase/acylaminoacyl peptidase
MFDPIAPTIRRAALALVLPLITTAPAVAESHPFNAHDLVTMGRVSDPQPSPDGRWVAFVVRTTDIEADRGRTDLWRVRTDGSALERLTTDPASDSSPRWSPDGTGLYFLSSRSGSSQVWRLPLGGGEAVQVTDVPLDVGTYLVSPDGAHLAVSLDVFPDCDTPRCTADRLAAEEASPANAHVYDSLFVRHWDTWGDGRRSHLFVVPADGGGEAVDVTRGLDADVPSKPFGGAEEIAFTPDGKGLVYTARVVGAEEPWSTDFDLYLVPVDGGSEPRVLTEANEAWDTQPAFSPDGRTLAYLAMARPRFEADRLRIVLLPWSPGTGGAPGGPAGEPRVLTEDWDRSVASLVWSPDGSTLYAVAGDVGQVALFAVDAQTGAVRKVVGEGHVRSPGVAATGDGHRIVFGRDTFEAPADLYSVAPDGGDLTRLTSFNAERLAEIRMGEPEPFSFPGWHGETVHGYVVKPADFDPAKRYPVAFLIHGGPQGSFGNDFHYRWNPQAYAGAGYAVVTVDFHGSTGYGQAFTDSISGDWGGKPLEDLQKGLAAALERYPFLDGDRVCALGASYGGYMINWIAGQWPERFRCLVNHDGVFDLRSMYYSTEELWFPEWEFGGPYWQNEELYERFNPVNFVERWKTPMLVIHGGRDFRLPETQGLGAFTALQRRGVPSRFLHFPEENHWVLSPANSLLWHETVLDWLARWLE